MDADLCHPTEAIAPFVDEITENGRDMRATQEKPDSMP